MSHHGVHVALGTSTGFSLVGLLEALSSPTAASWLAFIGSALTTSAGWYLSRRSELNRAAIERENERRQAARDQDRLDCEGRRYQQLQDLLLQASLPRPAEGSE